MQTEFKLGLVPIVLVSMLVGTMFALQFSLTNKLSTQGNGQQSVKPHFSVRWMGFAPTDYDNSYPEYHICINNLKDDPMTMQIALQIKNQEDRGYYFRIDQHAAAPMGWIISPYNLGYIDVDETRTFLRAVRI